MKIKFSKNEIPKISEEIINKILKMDNQKAKIITLSGDLGAGKTTLTQELAREFGIKGNIVSPTFVIMKIYNINLNSKYYSHFKKLIHIDAYRLDSSEELFKIGWKELISDKDNLILIEWPEKVKEVIGNSDFKIMLSHVDNETRLIEF